MNRKSVSVFKCCSHFPCVVAVRAVKGSCEDGVFVMIVGPLAKTHKSLDSLCCGQLSSGGTCWHCDLELPSLQNGDISICHLNLPACYIVITLQMD